MAMYNEITVTAELTNTEYMITKNYNLLENKPQINSVELTGNMSLEDLGINPDAEENVIDVVKVNGSALTPDANKAVNVTVTTGSDNGTVKVNGSDVAVKGLKSAAFTEATAYDAAGSAAEVQGNVDALTVVVNGKVDKEEGKGISTLQDIEVIPVTRKGAFVGSIRTQDQSGNWTNKDFYNQTEVDTSLSQVSTNPLQNRVIWQQLSLKANTSTVNTALAGKVDKLEGKGLFTYSDMVFHEDTSYTGDVVAHIVFTTQNPLDPQIQFDIFNGIEPITNAEIDALA